eukprot:TRINITY_DN16130_c0_g1_i1.p1 TRINITY_DN16130_c0_g1~~TRINITY_DN16130_c0_g1_i1.p1  ORF type:complete len:223 (+),score=14.88 TRINITY_DN16130_c0_g1_i1:108-776(+)
MRAIRSGFYIARRRYSSQSRHQGSLTFADWKMTVKNVGINGIQSNFQVSTGATTTQISFSLAQEAKLKGHKRLYIRSRLANGEIKADYLALADIEILSTKMKGMVMFSNDTGRKDQALLLGLSTMMPMHMELHLQSEVFSIRSDTPTEFEAIKYHFDWRDYMEKLGISEKDLVDVAELPKLAVAEKEVKDLGKSNLILLLGTSFPVQPSPRFYREDQDDCFP